MGQTHRWVGLVTGTDYCGSDTQVGGVSDRHCLLWVNTQVGGVSDRHCLLWVRHTGGYG